MVDNIIQNQININQNQEKRNSFNEELYEYKNKNEEYQDTPNDPIKKEKKRKGFVRIFRKCIKKKDKIRQNIIQKRFRKWLKQALKGLIIQQTLMIRISVSKEKDHNRHQNKFKMNIEDLEEKPRSVSKKIIKSIDKYPKKKNTKQENKKKVNIQPNIKTYNKNNETNNNNFVIGNNNNNFVMAKRINNYQGNNDNIKKKEINNKLIGINNIKPQTSLPKITYYDSNKTLYHINNLKNNYYDSNKKLYHINNSTKNNYDSNKNLYNMNNLKNNYYDSNKNLYHINNIKNNYIKIDDSSSSKQNYNNNNYIKVEPLKYIKQDNKKLNTTMPNRAKLNINLNNSKEKIQKEYKPYESNKNNYIRVTNNNLLNNYIRVNNNNLFNINTYQNSTIYNTNNNNNIRLKYKYDNYTSKKDNIASYSQLLPQPTLKPVVKSGVTTVIQHYSGKRRQYDKFNKHSFTK